MKYEEKLEFKKEIFKDITCCRTWSRMQRIRLSD